MSGRSALKKIKFAKKWLEKAEKAYLQGKKEEGFLSLSLAEAEIRTLQRNEWEGVAGGRRRTFREVVEAVFLAILIVFSLSSYLSVEREPEALIPFAQSVSVNFYSSCRGAKLFQGSLRANLPEVRVSSRRGAGMGGKTSLAVEAPRVIFSMRGGLFRSKGKSVMAHVFYIEPHVSIAVKKEKEREPISIDEMLRLVELGKREFKAYLNGGR